MAQDVLCSVARRAFSCGFGLLALGVCLSSVKKLSILQMDVELSDRVKQLVRPSAQVRARNEFAQAGEGFM
jgi:hypothetical protein